MKFLAFAAVAAAFAIPDTSMIRELILEDGEHRAATLHKTIAAAEAGVAKGIEAVDSWLRETLAVEQQQQQQDDDSSVALPFSGPSATANLTIYQIISSCNYTTQFAALVDKHADLVEMLNSTTANYTLFVPVDAALEKLPGLVGNKTDGDNDSDAETAAYVDRLLRYHIGLDAFSYSSMFATYTIPTAINETLLGDQPQRLRTRFEKHLGLRVNFDSRVVAANLLALNGVVHAVDAVLLPPPMIGRELALVPANYSTLLLAMSATNFTDEVVHNDSLVFVNGSTVFAPSNLAFTRLGADINAFLFNTPRGLKYLSALLRYMIVPNTTVYSDAYYGSAENNATVLPLPGSGFIQRLHYDLPTLLEAKKQDAATDAAAAPAAAPATAIVSLNVTRVPGWISILANRVARVAVSDGVAKNGVIHQMDHVLFPPYPPANLTLDPSLAWRPVSTIADVVDRLSPYVEDPEATNGDGAEDDVSDL